MTGAGALSSTSKDAPHKTIRSLLICWGANVCRARDGGAPEPLRQPVKREINNWCREQRQGLAENQAAYNADAQGTAKLRSSSAAQGQRQAAQHGGHRGHQDGPEAQQTRLINRVNGTLAFLA